MEGDPALVVRLVDACPMLHQESHHVNVVIDARLRGSRERKSQTKRRDPSCTVAREPVSGMVGAAEKSTASESCWGIVAAGAIPKCLHIAGVLEMPHSMVLLGGGGYFVKLFQGSQLCTLAKYFL